MQVFFRNVTLFTGFGVSQGLGISISQISCLLGSLFEVWGWWVEGFGGLVHDGSGESPGAVSVESGEMVDMVIR